MTLQTNPLDSMAHVLALISEMVKTQSSMLKLQSEQKMLKKKKRSDRII